MRVKLCIGLFVILLLTSCANPTKELSPRESSIFFVDEVQNCRITANKADVKSGAGNSFDTIGTLGQGDVVKVLDQIGNWYVVQLDNNRVGCVDAAQAEPVVKEDTQITAPPKPEQPQQQPKQPAAEVAEPTDRLTAQEQQMIDLVNAERKRNNLPPLKVDMELTRVARIKSQDMIDNDYFSHNSPTYGSPADMMKAFGIEFLYAGENLAANATVAKAHEGLMGSSGHRQNILQPNFTHIGIGIKPKDRSLIFTQMFIGRPE